MNQSGRRRIERAIRKLMEDDGDRCSICQKAFGHNIKTYGGVAADGVPALAGDCCRTKIKEILLQGIYVNRNRNAMLSRTAAGLTFTPEAIPNPLDRLQNYFGEVDKFGNDILNKAGMAGRTPRVDTAASPWKADDAAWFKANPTRFHRLRPMLEGEAAAMFAAGSNPEQIPPAHELAVIVRQVEPGTRIRIAFARNLEMPLPDVESIIHALFDVVSNSKEKIVSTREVVDLAKRYDPGVLPERDG